LNVSWENEDSILGSAVAEDKAASLAAGNPAIEPKVVRHVKP
jgi:hypothetical protein